MKLIHSLFEQPTPIVGGVILQAVLVIVFLYVAGKTVFHVVTGK